MDERPVADGGVGAFQGQWQTLADQVVRHLRRQIMLGQLAPGERLGEVQLTETLGVSRSTVREALRRLEAEYLVESASHRGSRVACLRPADAVEICDLHAMLETWAVQQMPLPLADELRARLEGLVEQMRLLVFPAGADQFFELDHAFHGSLVAAASQRWVRQIWSDISALLGILVTLSVRYLQVDADTIADRHQAIIERLCQPESSRPDAVQAVAHHYASLAQWLLQSEQATTPSTAGGI